MNKDTIHLIIFLALAAIVGIAGVLGVDAYQNRSKFEVGDCVQQVYKFEFEDSIYHHKIVAVGEKMYLTNQKIAGDDHFFRLKNQEWKFTLNKYEKVSNSNCEVAND